MDMDSYLIALAWGIGIAGGVALAALIVDLVLFLIWKDYG